MSIKSIIKSAVEYRYRWGGDEWIYGGQISLPERFAQMSDEDAVVEMIKLLNAASMTMFSDGIKLVSSVESDELAIVKRSDIEYNIEREAEWENKYENGGIENGDY